MMSIYLLSVLVFLGAFCGSLAAHYVVRRKGRTRVDVLNDLLPAVRTCSEDDLIKGTMFAPGEVKWMSKAR